ncbi:MAG TPA: membrane protein insertion efficiency factor YidD [Thermodesulfovibrionales bacterium]|nr:membrane protein insertion efficiency factor YidD [Thermodesulfovibrionales bacterium]
MANVIILILKVYQYVFSPLFHGSCRFSPSCSVFSIEAVGKYGAVKGSYLSVRRILRCHPFHPGGYDPVQ